MPEVVQTALVFGHQPIEMRLLLRCARWPLNQETSAEIRSLAAAPEIDWNNFLSFCTHHRVAPMVYHALSSAAPEASSETLAALKSAATQNAMNAFRYLAETRRLCALLETAGVPTRVLKGVPLSQRVYANPAMRDVGDIDLLIAPGMEERADNILIADGFQRSEPAAPLTPRRRLSWRRHGKDYTYLADRNGFEIDLHWRLFRNPYMPGNRLAGSDAASFETIQLGETPLSVLPLDRSFLFLCVHGALDGWLCLKSLVDVAALWSGFSTEQRDALAEQARDCGVLSELAAALALAQEFELLPGDALNPAMQLQAQNAEARWILGYSRRQHLEQHFRPRQRDIASWPLKRYEFGLRRDYRYRLEILRRILLRPRVWERFNLPDALFPLYALLSPLEWFLFHRTLSRGDDKARQQRSRWGRWRRLPASQRRLVVEAFCSLLVARCSLALLPARWIFRWMEKQPTTTKERAESGIVERIRWAILSVARYGPLSFVCFPQALAAHAMLRRRGIGSIMHYGVRRSADRRMRAHTWLEVDHRMLLGGESAMLFAPIHSSGAVSKREEL